MVKLFETLKRFFSGVCRLTPELLRSVKTEEVLKLELPETANHHLLESVYRLLWRRRLVYSLEIRKEGEALCFVSAENRESLDELVKRLMAVYPFPRMEAASIPLPVNCYVSAGYLRLRGQAYMLGEGEALEHALSAADNLLIQFLFRPEKLVVERVARESPVYRLRVAVAVFADDWREAAIACRRVLESFTVLSSSHSLLEPVIPRIPGSFAVLRAMLERRFLPEDSFRVTAEELASIARFPLVRDSSNTSQTGSQRRS
ncbi:MULTISPECIES: hypothetical protein [unclassified Archaeoglobus]|mgnify:CR=1 FL=1|uniref:hypothetical protein n=1 Tax=unclassified Archaeoglobus TaxID=2643606 RepID=UPI0025C65F8D|nr:MULTISPECIES: hypothetical protein [unclassified Archaeoglobus]